MSMLPQEIQVWYVLPALRRELASSLTSKHGLSQKKVAKILGISEGAISQYVSSKRGNNVKFSDEIQREIGISAKIILKEESLAMTELIRLSSIESVKKMTCSLHMKEDKTLPKGCDICFK